MTVKRAINRGMRAAALQAAVAAAFGVLALPPAHADATDAHGVWRTEANDKGAYLEVTVAPCDADSTLTCGTITRAIAPAGENPDYQHLGRRMVEAMRYDGEGVYSGGSIWDPQSDKVYKSRVRLENGELDVQGCVAFVCRGQRWQPVAGMGDD